MKKGYKINLEKETRKNKFYRKVVYTGEHTQLVLMSLPTKCEIGWETHQGVDQFFRFELGTGKVIVNETIYKVKAGDCVLIPSGSKHNIINTSKKPLKLYTLYSPPHHQDQVLEKNKQDEYKEKFDGKTTEN